MTKPDIPYLKLSSFYLIYFASVGTLIPFFGLYLQSLSLNALEIAQIIAMLSLARLVSPILWTSLSERWGCLRTSVIRAVSLTLLPIIALWQVQDYVGLLILAWWLGFFWHAILPSFETMTLQHLIPQPQAYSRIRVWGSIGFIVAVQGVGALMDVWGTEWFLISVTFLFVLLLWSAWWNDAPIHQLQSPVTQPLLSTWEVLGQRGMPVLMIAVMLMQVSHGVYYAFYSILLADKGYSATAIGALWSLGVLAEVIMFWLMHHLLSWQLSIRFWLTFGLAMAFLRWEFLAFGSDYLVILIIIQLLHAITFALFHTATMQALQDLFPQQGSAQAQAWYASLGYGVGGILGAMIAGYLWDYGQEGVLAFAFAGISAGLGSIIVWRYWLR
jgi:PPP family 3-phenylpropionic acid transporter